MQAAAARRLIYSCRSITCLQRGASQPALIKSVAARQLGTRSMSSGPTYTVDYLTYKLTKDLAAQHVDIEDLSNCGCGMKFDAVIVSPKFEGKTILQRQRLVNQILSDEMKHIHAFTMRTLTPNQWKEAATKHDQGNS